MPELPEAETIARDLRRRVVGRKVTGVKVTHADVLGAGLTSKSISERLAGRRIAEVGRRAKNVVLRFEDGPVVVVNLGMTGRLVVSEAPKASELRHVAVRFDLDHGGALLYDDVRRFGRIDVYAPETWEEKQRELGVEPLSEEFTPERLHELTQRSRSPIRNWLLDQRRVAGVGNIYANEALFRARIHPARPANTLSRSEATRLRDAIRDVLTEAIKVRGTTLRDYRDANGETGGFEPLLRVYGREGRPCPVCGTPIERTVIGNRSAFYCPHCQKKK